MNNKDKVKFPVKFGPSMKKYNDPLYMTFAYKPYRYNKLTIEEFPEIFNYFCASYFNVEYSFEIVNDHATDDKIKDILNNNNLGILFNSIEYKDNKIFLESENDPGLLFLKLLDVYERPYISLQKHNDHDDMFVVKGSKTCPTHWVSLFMDLFSDLTYYEKKEHLYPYASYYQNNKTNIKLKEMNYTLSEIQEIINKVIQLNFMNKQFSVTDSDFNAQRVSDKCVKFIKYANKLNSFYKYFHIAGAFEGGFSFETHHILDPLTRLAKYSNSYLSSRYDLRGSKHFNRQYSTNLWYLMLMYFWMKQFGLDLTELIN